MELYFHGGPNLARADQFWLPKLVRGDRFWRRTDFFVTEPRSGGKFRYKNFLWPNGFNPGCFQLHTSQNVATSMPSLTSQSCGDSLPSVCLAGQVGAIYRPPEHSWMPGRPVNEAPVKADR